MQELWLALAFGLIWHGGQIIWVAPRPSLWVKDAPVHAKGSPQAFQLFWLDQYAWIGYSLCALGVLLAGVVLWMR